MNKSNEKAGKSQSFQQQSTLLLSLSFLVFHFFDLSLRKFKKKYAYTENHIFSPRPIADRFGLHETG